MILRGQVVGVVHVQLAEQQTGPEVSASITEEAPLSTDRISLLRSQSASKLFGSAVLEGEGSVKEHTFSLRPSVPSGRDPRSGLQARRALYHSSLYIRKKERERRKRRDIRFLPHMEDVDTHVEVIVPRLPALS